MLRTDSSTQVPPGAERHFDVLIVGAGISGIGAAYHLARQCPGTTFAVLESQAGFGGTWRTHRYPGIRSDSDLYTFGYRFKPWIGKPIATADEILKYLAEVIDENDLARHIRYRHDIVAAQWSSKDALWTLDARDASTGDSVRFTGRFLWMCQGYYRHAKGYTPKWAGMAEFAGRIVHPQTWPDDLDCRGRRVVVIGSGATAATLIPSIAPDCAHVTMLQRSPTWFRTARNAVPIADELRTLGIREEWIHEIVRRKILHEQSLFMRRCIDEPEQVGTELLGAVAACLGPEHDPHPDFVPTYRPWRQRIAFVPDGDLFAAVRSGKASVATGEIERFVPAGILLRSGETLEADVIVTATGFDLSVLGDVRFEVDGRRLDFSKCVGWRGLMFTGVPNMAWVFGYFRASWTLRVDLVADFVCRLLNRMSRTGERSVVPALRASEERMPLGPWVDPENFNPGYLARAMHLMPKSGDRLPWQHTQDYWADKDTLPAADLDDGTLVWR